jgi:uncharacterized membrane protein
MNETLPALLRFYEWIRSALECLGALAIVVGAVSTVVSLVRPALAGERVSVTKSRFQLSRYLTLALEFQLSSDVLGTAIAPTWPAIGKLAAIGTIRTALNYFLTREMKEERGQLETALTSVDATPQDTAGPPSRAE